MKRTSPNVRPDLADGLQEGLGLDVAHGAADLGDDHVHVLLGHGVDPGLDLPGDVGDDLHRGAQVVAPALPVQDVPPHPAGADGGVAGEVLVHEALIVSQVQVGLGAVLGDEDLPVLEGAHGARVHIEVGVELLVPHPEAPLLQEPPQGRRADALPQAGHHTAGDKDEFRGHISLLHILRPGVFALEHIKLANLRPGPPGKQKKATPGTISALPGPVRGARRGEKSLSREGRDFSAAIRGIAGVRLSVAALGRKPPHKSVSRNGIPYPAAGRSGAAKNTVTV